MQPQPFIGPNDYWSWDFYANIFNSLDWNSLGLYLAVAIAAVLVLWVVFRLLRGIWRGLRRLFSRSKPGDEIPSVQGVLTPARLGRLPPREQIHQLVTALCAPRLARAGIALEDHLRQHRLKDDDAVISALHQKIAQERSDLELILAASPADRETARLQGVFMVSQYMGVITQRLAAESSDLARMRSRLNLSQDNADSLTHFNELWRKEGEKLMARVPEVHTKLFDDYLTAMESKVKAHSKKTAAEVTALKEELAKANEIIRQQADANSTNASTIASLSSRQQGPRPNTDPNKGGKGKDPKKNDGDDKDKAA